MHILVGCVSPCAIGQNRTSVILYVIKAVICFATLSLTLRGAEFISLTPGEVSGLSPYQTYNPWINVTAISGDGRTIAGQMFDPNVIYDCARNHCGIVPFVWSLDDVAARSVLFTPTPLTIESYVVNVAPVRVNALSRDGRSSLVLSEYGNYEAAIYEDDQPRTLRPAAKRRDWFLGNAMSDDAAVVIGNLNDQPFVWNDETGLSVIPGLPPGFTYSANSVSGDGRVIALNVDPRLAWFFNGAGAPDKPGNALQWDKLNGVTELSKLPDDDFSHVTASSFDGTIAVGSSISTMTNFQSHAVRWNKGVVSQLGSLDGANSSVAFDVSGDGTRAVGKRSISRTQRPITGIQTRPLCSASIPR